MKTGYWVQGWTGFRYGTKRIGLKWADGYAEAILYDEGAPNTTAAFVALLPMSVSVINVAWSGDMLLTTEPIDLGVITPENGVKNMLPGDIAYDPAISEVTFTYGVAECHTPTGPHKIVAFGQIDQGLDDFAVFGLARRYEGIGDLRIELLD